MRQRRDCAEFIAAFPYVIQMDRERYFRKQTRRKIYCGSLWIAKRFPDEKSAEKFVHSKLHYVGMEVYICRIGLGLLSNEIYPENGYWDGERFTRIQDNALLFPDDASVWAYQRENNLVEECYTDLLAQRTKRVCIAA